MNNVPYVFFFIINIKIGILGENKNTFGGDQKAPCGFGWGRGRTVGHGGNPSSPNSPNNPNLSSTVNPTNTIS